MPSNCYKCGTLIMAMSGDKNHCLNCAEPDVKGWHEDTISTNQPTQCPVCAERISSGSYVWRAGGSRSWCCQSCYRLGEPKGKCQVENDPVNHPSHYTSGGIETINVIEAWCLGFHLGNVVKYISRAGRKGSELEDLKKARWYLDRAITKLEGE